MDILQQLGLVFAFDIDLFVATWGGGLDCAALVTLERKMSTCHNGGLGLSLTDIAFFCLLERRRSADLLPPSSTICRRGFLFSPKIQMLVERYSY